MGDLKSKKKKNPLSFGSKYACLKFHLLHFSSFVVIFLAISTFIELLCVILYAYIFPKLPIVKYYRSKAASEGSKTVAADLAAAGIQNQSDLVTFGSIKNTTSSFILQYLSWSFSFALFIFSIFLRRLMIIPRIKG